MNSPRTQLRRLARWFSRSARWFSRSARWFKRHLSSGQSLLIFLLVLLLGIFTMVMFFGKDGGYMSGLLGVSPKSEVLKFIGIGMGGVLIALQALMSYKRAKAMEDAAKAQADAVLNTEQGLRQERLKNAIEHLGHENGSVRLGGAYELFHLAEDTPKLRQTVLDILCAHIRQTTGESAYRETYLSKPSEEIQSLLTLLFVQEHDVFKGCHINLQRSWLNGVNLTEARLEKAVLTEAHLQEAHLQRANLQEAYLEMANLQEAHLQRANLQEAYLGMANLQEAHLQRANLQEAHLGMANLQEAHLGMANLQEAYLEMANLQEAYLGDAHLQGAHLGSAHLQRASLGSAHLQGATLWYAHLQGAHLRSAHLQGAHLGDAHLQGATLYEAQLQGATLYKAQLQGATLHGTQLQGVNSERQIGETFAGRIRKSIEIQTDISEAIFEGGLSREKVEALIKGLSDEEAELRKKLEPHVGKPSPSINRLPENSGAITGAYTEEEAEKWINEYKEAMSEVPTSNTNTGDGQ